ncbi:MAG: hypothetical protein AB2L13_10620 [Spirochaetota bacterium]
MHDLQKVNAIREKMGAAPLTADQLAERRAKHLGTVPAASAAEPEVNELDAFEEKARAAARRLTEFKNDSGKTVVRGGNGVIVVGPPN